MISRLFLLSATRHSDRSLLRPLCLPHHQSDPQARIPLRHGCAETEERHEHDRSLWGVDQNCYIWRSQARRGRHIDVREHLQLGTKTISKYSQRNKSNGRISLQRNRMNAILNRIRIYDTWVTPAFERSCICSSVAPMKRKPEA